MEHEPRKIAVANIHSDMPLSLKEKALAVVLEAIRRSKKKMGSDLAELIRQGLTHLDGPLWQVIIGQALSGIVTSELQRYLMLKFTGMTILIFKAA